MSLAKRMIEQGKSFTAGGRRSGRRLSRSKSGRSSPVKVTFTMTGVRSIDRRLRRLGKEAPKAIRTAASLGAIPVKQSSIAGAPRLSGTLASSIKIRAQKASTLKAQGLGGFIGRVVTSGTASNLFTGKAFYGGFQEMGWKTGSRSGDKRPFFVGRDTFGPAAPGTEGVAGGSGGSWVSVRAVGYQRKEIPGKHFFERSMNSKRRIAQKIMKRSILLGITRLTKNEAAKKFKKQIIEGEFP